MFSLVPFLNRIFFKILRNKKSGSQPALTLRLKAPISAALWKAVLSTHTCTPPEWTLIQNQWESSHWLQWALNQALWASQRQSQKYFLQGCFSSTSKGNELYQREELSEASLLPYNPKTEFLYVHIFRYVYKPDTVKCIRCSVAIMGLVSYYGKIQC